MATAYTTNVYDADTWKTMEDAGAVFLPAAGYRDQKTVNMNENGRDLYYWTGTYGTSDNAIALTITKALNYIYTTKSVPVYYGAAVRLAKLGPVIRPLGKGKFTVDADGKKVQFTQGNLQYQASTDTWAVASSQEEIIGSGNQRISATNTEWIDLFGWGTGNAPTKHEQDDEYGEWVDWGTNTISNMALAPNSLRTLSRDEWEYIFHGRTNAENLFALGQVDGRNGVILLPDNWSTPSGLTFTPSTTKGMYWHEAGTQYNDPTNDADHYTDNNYSSEEWNLMEKNGAIFLPTAGGRDYRWATNVDKINERGQYWSSEKNRSNTAYYLIFVKNTIYFTHDSYLGHGFSVRLVRDVE